MTDVCCSNRSNCKVLAAGDGRWRRRFLILRAFRLMETNEF
jgi:hypothetical protein